MKAMNTRLNASEKKKKIITNVKETYYFAQCPKERTKKKKGITETRDITKADGPKAHKHL